MLSVEDKKYFETVLEKIVSKVSVECERTGTKFAYVPENGRYTDMADENIYWWCNGFYPGILWQTYFVCKDEKLKETAEQLEEKLDKAFDGFEGLHHDVGFMWELSAVANYRLTGNNRSKNRGLHAASLLMARYNPQAQFLRAWNKEYLGWVIVDSMMNLPLLYWASETTGDPRFKYAAIFHAQTAMKKIVRPDGSVNHIIVLDSDTGELVEIPKGQGFKSGSSWSRGQSWALYGFALSYKYTQNPDFLDTAKRIAHYFIANIQQTGFVPLVDFRAPFEPVQYDTTAGVIAACGLLSISEFVDEYEKPLYFNAAITILKSIETKYANWDNNQDGIITYGTAEYHMQKNTHVPIIYGDFFFIEAVTRLLNKNCIMW